MIINHRYHLSIEITGLFVNFALVMTLHSISSDFQKEIWKRCQKKANVTHKEMQKINFYVGSNRVCQKVIIFISIIHHLIFSF